MFATDPLIFVGLLHWPTRILASSFFTQTKHYSSGSFSQTTKPIAHDTWIAINTEERSISSRGWDGPRDWSDTGCNLKRGDSFQRSCVSRLRVISRVLEMCDTISFAHCIELSPYEVTFWKNWSTSWNTALKNKLVFEKRSVVLIKWTNSNLIYLIMHNH